MHLCRSWIICGALALAAGPFAVQAAIIYKWTDSDGVVHFSDQPVPGAEKFVTTGAARIGTVTMGSSAAAAGAKPKPTSTATSLSVSIDSPGNEQTITGNQPVKVHLAVTPDLKPGQAITWYLNGGPLTEPPDATQFTLEDLARGTYTLAATVVDQASGESKSAEPVTFYVMRTTLLSPQRKGSQ
jgi:hypothetical protein